MGLSGIGRRVGEVCRHCGSYVCQQFSGMQEARCAFSRIPFIWAPMDRNDPCVENRRGTLDDRRITASALRWSHSM